MMLQAKLSLVDDKNNDSFVPETQVPERGWFQPPLCNKLFPSLLVKSNKHFLICSNFVGWQVSGGCSSVLLWYPLGSSCMSWNIQVGPLNDWQQVLVISWELSNGQEHLRFLHVSFLNHLLCSQLHVMWVFVVLKGGYNWEGTREQWVEADQEHKC